MDYEQFFNRITGHDPYPYQLRLGTGDWPDILDIPTGLGKTGAVFTAWLFKRLNGDPQTPRRLVYCLPMRVLVEQTFSLARLWTRQARDMFTDAGIKCPGVHLLMGGEIDSSWAKYPERASILVGTQDMFLSRALMRGYGMSRYAWPVHFALLHTDSLWVYDEVQLMGAGLATSAQLEAFRRKNGHGLGSGTALGSKSLWASATINQSWLQTPDLEKFVPQFTKVSLSDADLSAKPVQTRIHAAKKISATKTTLTKENSKKKARQYTVSLCDEILSAHRPDSDTLVIVNLVDRAQAIFSELSRRTPEASLLLLHARFRPADRRNIEVALKKEESPQAMESPPGRIIVATQAIEAGVDISCAVLFTELAPWSSLAQRFGRCNRYGEHESADIFVIDIPDPENSLPYDPDRLAHAAATLKPLTDVAPSRLPPIDTPAAWSFVIRARDFNELFNTDPDLFGFDVDVSAYIRDGEDSQLQVFWRDFKRRPEPEQPSAEAEELCPVSMGQIRRYLKNRDAFFRDTLAESWRPVDQPRPGMVLMLRAADGGYSPETGFSPDLKKPVAPVAVTMDDEKDGFGRDPLSDQPRPVPLAEHLENVTRHAKTLCEILKIHNHDAILAAARWHDLGKAHPVFQATLTGCFDKAPDKEVLWAKSHCRGRHQRKYFRHELASALAWLENAENHEQKDLVAYLIAAHHGKVRMSLRAVPDETEPEPGKRFARGIREDDELPEVSAHGLVMPPTRLSLEVMEMGDGPSGPSWRARTEKLLRTHGPFSLAWMEAITRICDWRASEQEQEDEL